MSTFHVVVQFVNLFLAGILAGEEFVVRFGIRGPLATLDDHAHIEMRQALILKLRILVPAIFLPTAISGIVVIVLDGSHPGFGFRIAGMAALVAWILLTLLGTVPINAAALDWQTAAPPPNWKALVDRWEQLNTLRTIAAVIGFACFLVAVALRAP